MKLIREFKYTSKDNYPVTVKIFEDETGIVIEQIKTYDFDGSKAVDTVYIPKEFYAVH